MTISNDIKYVGVNDHDIDLFEGQYVVPRGMAYNSYAIIDGKIAVMDTVDQRFGDAWLANIEAALAGRAPDYLVVQHMEPDHSANIDRFLAKYPSATVVASVQAFKFMEQFFGPAVAPTRQVVKEPGGEGGRRARPRRAQAPFRGGPDGPLARGDRHV